MLAWWLGALLADIFAGRLKWRWHWVVVGAALTGVLALRYVGPLHNLGMGLIFSAVLAGGFLLQEWKIRLLWLEKMKPLGDMSYTLYVTHFPILVLVSGWLMSRSSKGLLPQHFGWVFGGIAATLLIAYGLHFIVERPFLSRVPHHKQQPITGIGSQ
jgi:peptidoglycan/LPS O-acetylase OafA/YrhL